MTAHDRLSAPSASQTVTAGLLTALVGFASSFAVVVQGLVHVGATEAEAASGLCALAVAMGAAAVLLSLRTRMPISIAWSTPGAALLATCAPPEGGFAGAVGAFLAAGLLMAAAGFFRPLGTLVTAIPKPIANAMLAGILLDLCLAPFTAIWHLPGLAVPIVVVWALVGRIARLYAVPAAVLVAVLMMVWHAQGNHGFMGAPQPALLLPQPIFVAPHFSWSAMIGIALPLFIVTMASQNIPGLAVLGSFGYRPAPGPIFVVTGALSAAVSVLGGHAINLAAITAALCAGPDAHPLPERRFRAAIVAGIAYMALGLLATIATGFISTSPPLIIEAVAGLALIGAFGGALGGMLEDAAGKEAGLITFLVTASGMSVGGIGSAFWGLVIGLGFHVLKRAGAKPA
jgi:benzoate membrane transport protein